MSDPSLQSQILALEPPYAPEHFDHGERLAYKQGHALARHAAAELALPLQRRVEGLEVENVKLRQQLSTVIENAGKRLGIIPKSPLEAIGDELNVHFGARISSVDGRPYLTCSIYPEKTTNEVHDEDYRDIQSFLRERGWKIEEPCCEHDNISGYLVKTTEGKE